MTSSDASESAKPILPDASEPQLASGPSTHWTKRLTFRVNISGIIEIMGSSLYSRADTPIRELLQNAHDGILRRRQRDLAFKGRIDVWQSQDPPRLCVQDDGIGLSAEEAETYLSTLGIGITGLLKKGQPVSDASELPAAKLAGTDGGLIGQFGIGLFSGFLLAERMVVESRRFDPNGQISDGIRWEAGIGTEVVITGIDREAIGTTVTLYLKEAHREYANNPDLLEAAVKEFADFLPVPIYLNHASARANLIQAAWFEPTPDLETLEPALETYFEETPLEVISIRQEKPVSIMGALYVTPRRTPGFAGDPVVTATVRRMVISRHISGLLPPWASFVRGVLELNDCAPTASRENLVRNVTFYQVARSLEDHIANHLEKLAQDAPDRLEAILNWHRYTLAGSALAEPWLRQLMRKTYTFPTSQGNLNCEQILQRSAVDALHETEMDRIVWYNADRRQERWANTLFQGQEIPCVHTLRGFEEALLASMLADASQERNEQIDLRAASPSSPGFAESILHMRDMQPVESDWQPFFDETQAKLFVGTFRGEQPVIAFLNERHELFRTFQELKDAGNISPGFQRMIDRHFEQEPTTQNEVVLNAKHLLVQRALSRSSRHPLASVLRLLVFNALALAGATVSRAAFQQQADDLDWIADTLWKRDQ